MTVLRVTQFGVDIPLTDWTINIRLNEVGKATVKFSEDYLFLIRKGLQQYFEIVDSDIVLFKGVISGLKKILPDGEIELELNDWIAKLDRVRFQKAGSYRVNYQSATNDPVYTFNILDDILSGEEFSAGFCAPKEISIKGNFETKLDWIKKLAENTLWGYDDNGNPRIGTGYSTIGGSCEFWLDDDGRVNIGLKESEWEARTLSSAVVWKYPNSGTTNSPPLINGEYWLPDPNTIDHYLYVLDGSSWIEKYHFNDSGYSGSSATEELYKTINFFLGYIDPSDYFQVSADATDGVTEWADGDNIYHDNVAYGVYGKLEYYGFYDSGTGKHYTRTVLTIEKELLGSNEISSFDITDHIINVREYKEDYDSLINKIHVLGYGTDESSQLYYSDEDTSSQNEYYLKEGLYTDRAIKYDSEASAIASRILGLYSEPPKRITVEVKGDLLREKTVRLGQFAVISGFDDDLDGSYRIVEIRNFKYESAELVLSNKLITVTSYLRKVSERVDNVVKYP